MTHSTEEQKQIAETIIEQLGGHLTAMIGANHMYHHAEGALSFKFKARASNGANHCKVTLDPSDTYTVVFTSVRGTKVTVKGEFEGIYNDQLKALFERETGLYLTMPTIRFARQA
jgi:hypothetical protein